MLPEAVSIPRIIPLFPLPNVVLFPHMPLPLHIFEPRYRKMVADALAAHRTIGMVLLRPGWESDYHGRPSVYDRGCAGVIHRSEMVEDGKYDLILKGVTRFLIVEEHAGEPYRLASVEPLPDEAGDAEALDAARRSVLAAIGRAADGPTTLVLGELPHDLFVNGLCQSLALEPAERQSLLECDSLLDRYRRLTDILEFRSLEAGLRPGDRGVH